MKSPPETTPETSAAKLRERVDRAVDEAHKRAYEAATQSNERFWRGREEALKDVRLWIAQELGRG